MKIFNQPSCLIIWISGLSWLLQTASHATSSTLASASITVDTKGTGTRQITGRVLNGKTRQSVPGATVSIGTVEVTALGDGSFAMNNVDIATTPTLRIQKTNFLDQYHAVIAPFTTRAVCLRDIYLWPLTDKPVIEWIRPEMEGIYLAGFGMQLPLKTRVNWNGTTAGSVTVEVNGHPFATLFGEGPEYTTLGLSVDNYLTPSFNPQANKVTTIARNGAGLDSDSLVVPLAVIPVPNALARVVNSSLYQAFGPDQLGFDFTLFPVKQVVTIPVLGKFGFEFGLNTSFDYTMSDGEWELAAGLGAEGGPGKRGSRPNFPGLTRSPKLTLYLGDKEITGKVAGKATGTATRANGVTLTEVGATAELSAKLELTRYSPLDVIPGLTSVVSKVPSLEKVLRNASMIVYAKPGLTGDVNCGLTPRFGFKDATLEGTLGIEAAYEPKVGKLEASIYSGGEGRMKFGLPAPVFREIGLKFYFGYKISVWGFEVDVKNEPWGEYTYPPTASMRALSPVGAPKDTAQTWHISPRPWRDAGLETFLQESKAQPGVAQLNEGIGSSGISPELDVFNRMGAEKAVPLAVGGKGGTIGGIVPRVIPSDPNLPAQAVLPLLANVFPGSEPSLAQRNGQLMVLYVRDTGVANPVQFTEIAFTRYDGTTWSTPAAVAPEARAQFAPQVMFAGNGDAVAVWERVNDAAFTSVDDPLALGAHMEIVWSRWTSATGTWSAPVALTANAVVDHSPHLAGPLADGDLFLTWIRNNGNRLAGEGVAGAVTNDQVMLARWDTATLTWNTPTVLVDALTGDLSHSLAAAGGKAVYAWTTDMDGNLDNLTDTEVFVRTWDGAVGVGGTWSAPARVTNDALPEGTVRVVVDPGGNIYPLWQHGSDLVMQKNFTGALTVVRADSGTMGFADFALTAGPGGNVLALWQEMTEAGSDAHYRVYDPASSTWGLDTLLSNDAALERSFAPVWDSAGNMVVAYNNVDIVKQAKTVVGAGGVSTTIQGVPQPGQVNLLVARRALVKDLSFLADSLVATGTDFLPGDVLTIKATVRNTGNLAVENVVVSFYDGDPSAGGALIQAVTVAGWLNASDQREVSVLWTVPGAATTPHTIFSVVDQAAAVTEQNETNNKISLSLGGTDLDLHYLNGSVLADGSVRVVARIKNLGAPSSPVAELKLWPKDNPGANPLATVNVSQLPPGESVEVPMDLPAGAQPEGDRSYRLTVNEAYLATEANAENNATIFSLTLWIDNDNDGMPAGWEGANGLSDSNAADAGVDSDGDGFTNVQEYLAGTNPRNAASRLKAEEWSVRSVPGTSGHEFTVSWASVVGHSYVVERSFNMTQWAVVATGVQATPPLNTFTDTVETAEAKVFYRIRAQ